MLDFNQVSKRYGAQIILDNASFRIHAGDRLGVVGPNGAGKSTLFELIAGGLSPDSGSVTLAKNIRLGWLRQQLPDADPETALLRHVETAAPDIEEIRSEIRQLESAPPPDAESADEWPRLLRRLGDLQARFEAAGGYGLQARAATALAGLGFHERDLSRPLSAFSGGWRMRAELARALLGEPDLLLLDEPSNYLDLPAVEWLRRRLDFFRGTLVLISHDRYLLESLCTATLEVAAGRVTRYSGPYSFYAAEREKRRAVLLARQAGENRRRAEMERFIDRFRAKNTLAARVQSKIKALEKMEHTEVSPLALGRTTFRLAPPPHCGQEILRCESLGFAYEPDHWIFRNFTQSIQRGDKIALVGPNGAGKTTLLRVIAGALAPVEGTCRLGHLVRPGYQSQETADTLGRTRTCLEVLKAAGPDASESEIRTLLGGFGFSGAASEKHTEVLSGGERIRLAFARLLLRPPNLLLLDEPTTHLDVESREALQEALRAYQGSVLFVSHDVAFVRAVAQGILAIAPDGGGVRRYPGGYDYFREKAPLDVPFWAAFNGNPLSPGGTTSEVLVPSIESPTDAAKSARRAALHDHKAAKNELKKIQAVLAALENEITALENEITELQTALADPQTSPPDRKTAGRRLKEVEQTLDQKTADWEAALQRQEALR